MFRTIAFLTLAAASPAAADPLTLETAVASALARSPDLARADADVERERALLAVAGRPANPTIRLDAATDGLGDDDGARELSLELEQELWWPGQRGSRRQAAAAALETAQARSSWARARTVADAAAAFARLVATRRKEGLLTRLVEDADRMAAAASQRFDVGDLSSYERDTARWAALAAVVQLDRARADTLAARVEIARMTGLDVGDTTEVVEPALLPALAFDSLDAGAARADVTAAEADLVRAEAVLRAERRARLPRPSFSLGWQRERSFLDGDNFAGLPFADDALVVRDEGELVTLGVGIAIPLFDRNQAGIAAAISDRVAAQAELVRLRAEAAAEREVLLERSRLLGSTLERLGDVADLFEGNLRAIEKAREVGRLSLSEFLTERERLLRARLEYEDLRVQALEVQARLAARAGALHLLGAAPGSARP